jgi:MGT family glycosyltransferase
LYDHLYLDVYPPGLQPAVADHVGPRQLLRPVAYDVAEDSRREVELPDAGTDRPLVYLTMGTVFNDPTALRRVVDAIAALDVRLLVTVGPNGDPEALGDQPPHVRVERYVPQTLVLDRCGVIVSHAASGTVLATLSLGLPQLCLPQGADQFGNAAAVAGAGAGVALLPVEASGEAIADALGRLLAERSFRDAATRVSETIASMPGPDDVAEVLERLP